MSVPRILVIEDNSADVQLLRHGLDQQHTPYELMVLQDGEAALGFIHHQRSTGAIEPCVIVLDLHLPKHNGMEILKAVRQEPLLTHISVVVLTTVARPEEKAEAHRMGAYLIEKPMELRGFSALANLVLELCSGEGVRRIEQIPG